jgi:autotransporter-associated beta strand protein
VDTLYRGAINGNVRLVKDGSGELILNPTLGVSGYRGGTELLAGVLSVGSDAALGWAPLHADAANITFNGGTLRTTSSFALAATRGLFFEGVGGAIEVADGEQLTIDSEIHTAQGASFGKTGTGALLVNREQSYEGDTQVMEGVLVVGAEDVLSRWSRHYVYGGLESGVLDLNGFDVSIGSLASAGLDETAATVLIGANTLTLGYDGTMDAVYQGVISGLGRVVKVGGGTQTFSGNANGAEGWSLDVAEGTVVVGAQGALGSGSILLGTDDHAYGLAALQLMAEAVMTQAITVGGNHQGSVAQIRQQVSGTVDLDGTLTLNRDLFLGAAASSVLSLNEAVSGVGRITVLDEGTVRLGFANTFGAGAGTTSSSAVDGGLIIRSGTVELGSGLAAGSGTIEMGDLAFGIAAVAGATTAMLDAAFDPTGNGLGGTGLGALSGVPDTIDGVTYVVGDRILVKDQHAAPEQNGVYEVVSVAGGQMVLVRASDFNAMAPNLAAHLGNPAITYGVQVPVTGGGQAGQSFFVASKNMGLLNESPIVFLRDVVSPNVALMQSASGLTVANAIDLNSLNSSGTMTLGGNFTSGSSTFSGPITLTNMLEDTAETVTLVLSSASGDDAGVLISGVISEADSTDLTGDTLSLMKVGSGVVTLSGVNTFRGATLISEGTLAISSTQALGLAPAAFSASHLTIDGGALRALSSFSLNEATRGITLGAGGGTLDVVDGETLTVSGVIAGAGNLQKTGTGTVVLEADNTFGGSTSVLAGVLAISSEANLGPNPAVFDAAHLLLDGGALRTTATFSLQDSNRGVTLGAAGGTFAPVVDTTLTIANVIAGSGNLIKADAGTLILSAANTYTGDTLVTGGTLVLSAADSISPGAVLISGGGVLDVGANTINVDSLGFAGVGGSTAGSGGINAANGFVFTNTNPVSVSNALGGTGSLEVSGPGSVTLLGMNSYSGGTTISDAALFVGPGSSLGSGPVSVQAGGTLSAVGSLGNDIHFAGGFGSPAVLQVGSESQGGGVNLLTLGGAVSFDDEAIIDFYLSQTGFSQLELANLTSFDPGARFRINLVDGYMPADGSAFQILAWDASALGAVNWLDRMILPGGVNWVVPADFSTSGLLTVFGDATDPSFILQPAGVVTSIGGSITLTVAVAGSEPILIQWVKDGDDLPGETNLTLSIPFAELTDGGNYRARATNGVDTALSDLVLVVVSDTPVVVSLPQGATILQGGSHTFEVSAVGPGPFTYEWKRGAVVVGGDSPVLEITNAQFSDAGSYTVTITNANGSVDTVDNPAVLVVSNPVSFDEHPENVTAAEGRTVTFNTLVSGTGPFEFQWQLLGGSGWEDVAGAEGDSLTLTVPNAVEGTEFQYRLRAASTQGGDPVFSDVAVLTVGSPLIDLTGALPAGKIIRTGEDLVIEVQPAGGALPMTYQWFFNGTAIPGQTHAELLIPNASLAQVGAYRCQLSNTYTTASGTANDLKVTGDVLVAVVDSADAWLAVQDTAGRATLRVTARARTASDLSYQWVDGNGNDILGATAASYTASDLLGGQVYDFSCRVTYAPAADSAIGGETVVYVYTGAPQWPAGVPLTSSPTNPIPLPDGSVGQGFNYQVPLPGQTVTDNAGTPVASGAATAANMPASFSASGLPPGLRIDNRGQITGVPTAERRDRSGAVIPYVITVTARNNYGVVTPVLVFSLTIQPLADTVVGDFTGPIERHYLNDNLGGAVLVKTNKRGAYTGTVTMGTKRFRFRGALVSTGVGSNPEATAVISRGKRLPALVMTFALDATTQVISVGNIREATDNSGDMDKRAQFTGWRYVFKPSKANKTPAAAYAGVYNVGLFLPDELVDETSTLVPQGIGYASFNINAKNGRLRVNGRLGDGTAFVTATYVGPGGQVMVFRTLYNAKARGSVVGSMTVDLSQVVDTGSGLVGAVTGSLDWLRPALATSALYPAGFQVEELEVEGSRYVAPARFERVMGLPAANFGDSNALVRFAGANLEVDQQPLTGPVANSVGLRVDELNKVQADLLNDPRLLTMRIVSKSGAFNGRYTLEEANPIVGARPDRIRRVTSYQGLIIRVNDGLSWTPMGVGYTLVRQLPNRPSANLSGSVVFEKLP